jgi:hypothetical protein
MDDARAALPDVETLLSLDELQASPLIHTLIPGTSKLSLVGSS